MSRESLIRSASAKVQILLVLTDFVVVAIP